MYYVGIYIYESVVISTPVRSQLEIAVDVVKEVYSAASLENGMSAANSRAFDPSIHPGFSYVHASYSSNSPSDPLVF